MNRRHDTEEVFVVTRVGEQSERVLLDRGAYRDLYYLGLRSNRPSLVEQARREALGSGELERRVGASRVEGFEGFDFLGLKMTGEVIEQAVWFTACRATDHYGVSHNKQAQHCWYLLNERVNGRDVRLADCVQAAAALRVEDFAEHEPRAEAVVTAMSTALAYQEVSLPELCLHLDVCLSAKTSCAVGKDHHAWVQNRIIANLLFGSFYTPGLVRG